MTGSILIAGIGNIFNRDDAFGVVVASEILKMPLPGNVRVADFGIRGFDLVLALLEEFDLTIFVDAVERGQAPGTLYLIEHQRRDETDAEGGIFDNAHGLDPLKVLAMAERLGARTGRVIVVGCEPESLAGETGHIGLTDSVQGAVPAAIEMIRTVIGEFNQTASIGQPLLAGGIGENR